MEHNHHMGVLNGSGIPDVGINIAEADMRLNRRSFLFRAIRRKADTVQACADNACLSQHLAGQVSPEAADGFHADFKESEFILLG
ncbi:hypothetical protein D3C81_1934820 [compost metagenome]